MSGAIIVPIARPGLNGATNAGGPRSLLEHDLAVDEGRAHAPLHLETEERRVAALAAQRRALDAPRRARVEHAEVRRHADVDPSGVGTPEDVAGAVRFLVSPAARYITGTVIAVDGGMAMSS
jgi:NAD(P)-dependent dehydrogenase (short-subunit alcohol dehydrogenase family)